MLRIKILTCGKTKEEWLTLALKEYEKRLSSHATIDWIVTKTEDQLEEILQKEERFICLDPKGALFTSEAFFHFFQKIQITYKSRPVFAIGGPFGFSSALKEKASHQISLSPLTFTHQLTRLILLEQLYRSLEIEKGSSYHK